MSFHHSGRWKFVIRLPGPGQTKPSCHLARKREDDDGRASSKRKKTKNRLDVAQHVSFTHAVKRGSGGIHGDIGADHSLEVQHALTCSSPPKSDIFCWTSSTPIRLSCATVGIRTIPLYTSRFFPAASRMAIAKSRQNGPQFSRSFRMTTTSRSNLAPNALDPP